MFGLLCLAWLLMSDQVSSQNYTQDTCADVFVNQSGEVFFSPDYPGNYSSNLVCDYYATAPKGYHVALAFSTPFELETSSTCVLDYFTVHDGPSMNDTLLGKFCGFDVPSPVFSYGRHLSARFKSDGGVQHSGFYADILFKRDNCSFEIFEDGSFFTSPNFPANYNDIERCEYIVTAPEGHYISLTFHNFSLEDSRNCLSDAVTMYNGDTILHPVLELLCGTIQPQTFFSHGNKLLVRMTTDLRNTSYGFNASVSFHKDVCNHIITNNGSVITSPNHPENYGNFVKCEYHVHCDEGEVIEVTLLSLDIEEHDNCLKDRLTFYDGDSYSSMVLARLCGFQFPNHVIKTSGQDLLIVFTTNNVLTETGFRVRVNFVTAPCDFCSVYDRYYENCPSNAPPAPFVQKLQLKRLPQQEFLRCHLLTGQYATASYSGEHYWMIGDCPEGTNVTLRDQCVGEDQDIYNIPLYHPLLKVLFKNKHCALCNGYSLDVMNKQTVYSTCDTCKYTYEFIEGDVLETPSSDCKVHPKFLPLEKCHPFRKEEDIECPIWKPRRGVATIFRSVADILTSSLTCPDEHIAFGEKCVKISSSCSSTFQENLLVLEVDISEYSQCNYLAQRSTLCFFNQFKNFEKAILKNKAYEDMQSINASHSFSSFFLPWINFQSLEWLENSRGSKVFFKIPVNVTSSLKWKDNILAALQGVLVGNARHRNITKYCFLKSVALIDICKLNLEQDATKCDGVIDEVGYNENDENLTYSNFKKSVKTFWYGVVTTLQVSEERVLRRKLVFCSEDDNLHENKPRSNLFNDFSCGIAVICLLVTFLIYATFSSLRNTFGIVVMVFVKSLAFGIILLQFVNPYITNIPWFCSLMGIVTHWLWISIFCWMTVLAYDLRHTFGASNMRIANRIHRKALITYFCVGWGLPLIVVVVCITLWSFTEVPISYGSHSGGDCWIYDSAATLAAVSGPLLLCILTNLIFFILIIKGILEHRSTTREARLSARAARSKSQAGGLIPELIVCIKISLLMGFTWLSGYIAPLTNIDAFQYLFYFLILLQAILIFIFFGANTRVRKLLMQKTGASRLQSFGDTIRTSLDMHSTNVST